MLVGIESGKTLPVIRPVYCPALELNQASSLQNPRRDDGKMHLDDRTNGATLLPSLTGLRGIAALWVVIYHYGIHYFPSIQPGAAGHIIEKGYLAVDFFFLLSGFVLTHVYIGQFAQSGSRATWPFLRARIARLYPLHIFILGLFVLDSVVPALKQYGLADAPLHIKEFGPQSVSALIASLFMLQGLKASALSWNYPTWSISVEFAAYLLFPLAAAWLWRAGKTPALLGLAVFAAYLAGFSWLVGGDFNQWDGWTAFARCIPEFFAGVLLYICMARLPSMSRSGRLAGVLALGLLILLQIGAADGVIVFLFACTIPLLVHCSSAIASVLNGRAVVLLGELSYALYLVHGLVQTVAGQLLATMSVSDDELPAGASLSLMLSLVALSLLCAYWAHKAIELPGRRYLRTALQKGKLRVPQAEAPAATLVSR
jgi:peptidoglycan/LPS O-acetylase OafA/YrhL